MNPSARKNGLTPKVRDPCHCPSRDLTSKENHLLVVSLWHGLFFPSIESTAPQNSPDSRQNSLPSKNQTSEEEGVRMESKGVLRLLEAVGYCGARKVLVQLENALASDLGNMNNPSSDLASQVLSNVGLRSDNNMENGLNVDFNKIHKLGMSFQRYFFVCATEYAMSKGGPQPVPLRQEEGEPEINLTPLQTVLQAALDMHQQQRPIPSAECADELYGWFSQIAHAIICKEEVSTRVNKEMNHIEAVPLLFELTSIEGDVSSSVKTPGSDAGVPFQEQSWLKRIFHASMLYGALCVSSSYTAVRPLAVLLTAYIFQDCPSMKTRLLSITCPTSSTITTCSEHFDDDFWRVLTLTRLRGVVAGVLEFTLRLQDADVITVRRAVDLLMEENGNDSYEMSSLEGISPEPGKSLGVLQSAVILLMQLIQRTVEWTTTRCALGAEGVPEHDPDSGASSLSTRVSEPIMAAKEIVHEIQELLFAVVLGAGTLQMPNRPTLPTAAKPLPPHAKKLVHPKKGLRKTPSLRAVEDGWMVVTRRALTLGEADALCEGLFPALLQQLGWEWPWSELLRQCRMLDKQQQAPPFPFIAWRSCQLIDTVLMRVAQRTYPKRLQYVLPRSYHRLLDALDLSPCASTGIGEVAGEGSLSSSPPELFPMPPYYAEAGGAVVGYLRLSGLGGVRVGEVERVLSQATRTLPMVVRLRALAPPSPSQEGCDNAGDGRGARALLSVERVEELEARYRAEVLLASVVSYTQLRVPSQVQSLMRTLAPLFDKLSSACCRNYASFTSSIIIPASTNGTSRFHINDGDGNNLASVTSAFGLCFTKEVEHLINRIGYQFYPLEWMPAVATAYYESISTASSNGNNDTSAASRCIASSALPYSVFAAVAHQFGANFNIALGSSGEPSQRHPAGAPATLVVPSFMTSRSSGVGYVDSNLRSNISDHSVNKVVRWKRADFFLQVLMLDCFLCCRSSSCELEGTMAVAGTRRVHTPPGSAAAGHESTLWRAAGNLRPGILEAFWTQEALCSPSVGKAEINTEAPVSGDRTNYGNIPSLKRARREEEQTSSSVEEDREAIKGLVDVLLSYGAASFETTVESKDIILVLMQSFLPSTALENDGGNKSNYSKARAEEKTSTQFLRQASAWAQEMVGSQAEHSRVRMLLRQKLQSPQTSLPASSHHLNQIHSVYHAVFNSCTWDACSPARRIFRQVPSRLLEKAKLRRAITDSLTKWRDACLQDKLDASASLDLKVSSQAKAHGIQTIIAAVDPLLRYQWLQWKAIIGKLDWKPQGTDVEFARNFAMHPSEIPDLSTAQWLWYSSYFTQSL
ncbi:unnamed protein product [Phytomonas sp. EM1]|nr:unnamed protein product [Phytomonas sp. EM1]|eukprot:CCW60513.1 unnamed protein product [Phytomonas sp. isolate EM1]